MKIDPNDPVFYANALHGALTVRAYIATQLLAGMFSGRAQDRSSIEVEINEAVQAADKLMAELNRES